MINESDEVDKSIVGTAPLVAIQEPDIVDKFLADNAQPETTKEPDIVDRFLSDSLPTTPERQPDEVDRFLSENTTSVSAPAEPDIVDKFLSEDSSDKQAQGILATAGGEAIKSLLPTSAGLVGGLRGGALGFEVGGPVGAIIGGIGGAVLSSWGASKAQDTILASLLPEETLNNFNQQQEINRAAHPVAAWAGEMAPQLVALKPNPRNALRAVQFVKDWTKAGRPGLDIIQSTKIGQEEFENLINVSMGAGTGAAGAVINKIRGGDVTWMDVMRDMAIGAVLNDSTVVGRALGIPSVKLETRGKWVPETKSKAVNAAAPISTQPKQEPAVRQESTSVKPAAADMASVSKQQSDSAMVQQNLSEPKTDPPVANQPSTTIITDHPVLEVPVKSLKLSEDVPNFKEGANLKGVVEPLAGKYTRLGTAPIVAWERLDGRLEVITGRHRLELAERSGERTIPAQIVREANGFTKTDALVFDAESNIRDNQGSVKDYANYFRNSGVTDEQASSRGLLARKQGRNGYSIGKGASDDLYALYRNQKISEAKAVAIADVAPGNAELQAQGVKFAADHTAEETADYLKAIKTFTPATSADQIDMFGHNDAWQIEAKAMAATASKMRRILDDERAVLKSAVKLTRAQAKQIVEKYGINPGDETAVLARLNAIDQELKGLESWYTNAELVNIIRTKAGLAPKEITVKADPFQLQTVTPEQQAAEVLKAKQQTQIENEMNAPLSGGKPLDTTADLFGATEGETPLFNQRQDIPKPKTVSEDREMLSPEDAIELKTLQDRYDADSGSLTADEFDRLTELESIEEGNTSTNPAAIETLTMPRHIEAERQPDLDLKTGRPISLADIRRYLSKSLDIPIMKGGFNQKAHGIFKTKSETIRQKLINDLPTALHEVGHYLHFLAFNDEAGRIAGHYEDWGKTFDHELISLGAATSRPSYSKAMRRQEGVANFMFHWMTDRAKARAMAPDFTAHWENTIQTKYPEIWKTLERSRDMLELWQRHPAQMKVRSMIMSAKDLVTAKSWRQKYDQFKSDWVDSHYKIIQALDQAQELGENPTVIEMIKQRLENYRGGWRGKVEYALNYKAINLAGKDVGEGLADIIKGHNTDELDTYLVARRALEIERQGKRTGVDRDAAKKTVDELSGKYEGIRRRLRTYQKIQRDLLVDSGLISRDLAVKMDSMNESYVPFYRIYEGLTGQSMSGSGTGLINLGQGVYKMKGSDKQIVSPLESIIRNSYAFRDLAERNQIARQFTEVFGKLQGGGRVADNITGKMKPVKVSAEEIRGFLQHSGIIDDMAKQTGRDSAEISTDMVKQLIDNEAALNLWKQAKSISSKDGIFSAWKDGRETLWQIQDPDLYRALAMADESDAKMLSKYPSLRILNSLTRILRAGATLTPEFIWRNLFRDPIGAFIYSKHKFVPIWDGFRGVMSAINKDDLYREWLKNGGSYSDFVMGSQGGLTETLKDVVKDPSMLEQALEWANPLNAIKNLEKLSEFAERGTRLAVFRRAIEAGIDPQVAANLSKDTTLNYAKHGYKAYMVNKYSAFFNASIRDADKLITEHSKLFSGKPGDRAGAVGMMIKATASITTPSILAWYLGKDDPEVQALPAWRKTLFWNFNLSDMVGEPFMLSLPKPFMLGQIYGSSVEVALDYGYKRDPKLVGEWAKQMLANVPNPIKTLIPDAILPAMGVAANYNWFTDRKIVADNQSKLEAKFQYNPDTSEIAKAIGNVFDISPLKIDYLVRAHLGGSGRYGSDMIDAALVGMMGQDIPERPAKRWYDLPGIKAFHTSPYASDRYLDAFYRGMEKAEQRHNTMSAMAQTKMRDFNPKWWETNRNANVYYEVDDGSGNNRKLSDLRKAGTLLSEYAKAMLIVQNSRELDAETKRQRLIKISQERNVLARNAYENLLHPDDR